MRVCLVHHADAVGPQDDPQRPLSDLGRRQAAWLADVIRDRGFRPTAIWHSGKLRSRQTAEAFLHARNPFAEFRMVRGLRPDDPPDWLRDALTAETREVLAVGHMPNLPALARMLSQAAQEFPLHGVVGFERVEGGGWREFLRAAPALSPG